MPWIKRAPQPHICQIPFDERSTFGDVWECDECKAHWERVTIDDGRIPTHRITVRHNKYFIQIMDLIG